MSKVLDLMRNFESALLVVGNMKDEVNNEIEYLSDELSKCDLEVVDLLHYCEFVNFNAVDGYVKFKELKNIQLRRREIKNELFILRKLMKKLNNKSIGEDVSSLLMSINHTLNTTVDLKYKTRIREDLQDKIDKSTLKINENGGL